MTFDMKLKKQRRQWFEDGIIQGTEQKMPQKSNTKALADQSN